MCTLKVQASWAMRACKLKLQKKTILARPSFLGHDDRILPQIYSKGSFWDLQKFKRSLFTSRYLYVYERFSSTINTKTISSQAWLLPCKRRIMSSELGVNFFRR